MVDFYQIKSHQIYWTTEFFSVVGEHSVDCLMCFLVVKGNVYVRTILLFFWADDDDTCEITNYLQVRQLSMILSGQLTLYTQFDNLLSAATDRLDITERLLDKYSETGNVNEIAAHINSIKVEMFFWYF